MQITIVYSCITPTRPSEALCLRQSDGWEFQAPHQEGQSQSILYINPIREHKLQFEQGQDYLGLFDSFTISPQLQKQISFDHCNENLITGYMTQYYVELFSLSLQLSTTHTSVSPCFLRYGFIPFTFYSTMHIVGMILASTCDVLEVARAPQLLQLLLQGPNYTQYMF